MRRWVAGLPVLVVVLVSLLIGRDVGLVVARAAETVAPQIWFSPLDPFPRGKAGSGGSADFMDLFQPGSSWSQAASHVQVFSVYPQFLREAPDSDLATTFRWLNEHHIGLAVETGLLHPQLDCKRHEGYDADQLAMAQHIRRLGGTLRYVVADGPLGAGHANWGPGACQTPISALAQDAASSAHAFTSVFPQVRFLDAEGVSNFRNPDWVAELGQFLSAFQQANGQPFAGVVMDVAWWQPGWQQRVAALSAYLKRVGMPIGVFYDGNPEADSDGQWLAEAAQHIRGFQQLIGGPPTYALFQSWHRHPTRVLPETSSAAFTSLVLSYARGM
jgi:hypothetical protein